MGEEVEAFIYEEASIYTNMENELLLEESKIIIQLAARHVDLANKKHE